jgi:hypothetical protein
MAIATYTLADYIQALRTVTSETQDPNEIIARVGPLAERAALSREWLKPQHYACDPEQGFGVHLLHEEADHTLAEAKHVKALVQKALDEASDVLEDTTTGVA